MDRLVVGALERAENSTTVRARKRPHNVRKPVWLGPLQALDRVAPALTAEVTFGLFLRPKRHPRPAREFELLERGRAFLVPTDRTIHAGPHPLHAWSFGDAGPTVLLVHGWQGRGAQLGAFIEPLLRAGRRVVTFDAPAHGDTAGSTSSLFAFRDAILAMHDACGDFEAIVSHSMGGAGVVLAADERPIASRFAMLCPPNDLRDFTAELTAALGLSEATRAGVHARLERRFDRKLETLRASAVVARRTEPLLLVHDAEDREVPLSRSQEIAAHWPGAELVVTRGLGHRKVLGDAGVITKVVEHVTRER